VLRSYGLLRSCRSNVSPSGDLQNRLQSYRRLPEAAFVNFSKLRCGRTSDANKNKKKKKEIRQMFLHICISKGIIPVKWRHPNTRQPRASMDPGAQGFRFWMLYPFFPGEKERTALERPLIASAKIGIFGFLGASVGMREWRKMARVHEDNPHPRLAPTACHEYRIQGPVPNHW